MMCKKASPQMTRGGTRGGMQRRGGGMDYERSV